MGMVAFGTECYLFLNGISVSNTLQLHDGVYLHPVQKKAHLEECAHLLENDVDFAVFVLSRLTVAAQLQITAKTSEFLVACAWNSQWDCLLLGALLNCNVMCNVQCNKPIEQITEATYLHITNYELRALLAESFQISADDEVWISQYYQNAYRLLEDNAYQTAVHAMASYQWHSVPRVQLAILWSGIESLFNVSTEVSFRISLYIANFLTDTTEQAKELFQQVRRLYSARSTAVHGNKIKNNLEDMVQESASLLNRILRCCAERNSLPNMDDLVFRS